MRTGIRYVGLVYKHASLADEEPARRAGLAHIYRLGVRAQHVYTYALERRDGKKPLVPEISLKITTSSKAIPRCKGPPSSLGTHIEPSTTLMDCAAQAWHLA